MRAMSEILEPHASFLIADAGMTVPNFPSRCLHREHNDQCALGIIVNRPI